ncbi:MAG TPA: LemA family protein [Frankiaceae bacterium]|nr:LemA family protein [Frankiaceae bacterium]
MNPFAIAGGAVLLLGLAVIISYNRFVRQRNLVEESWRQVDVELRRRYDLIPNLVETVKGYAAHERATFEAVTQARAIAQAHGGTRADQGRDETELTRSLRGLLAVAEAYPALKADQHFRQLQSQLAETEDRIAAGRRFYNANVRAYNTRIDAFPSSLIAGMFGFEKAEYFEVEEAAARAAVPVQMDGPTA